MNHSARAGRFTLHGDGSSDRALLPIVAWVLRQQDADRVWEGQWADLGRLRSAPRDLRGRLRKAVELYPCDLLFVHRDAESSAVELRVREIMHAANGLGTQVVPLVPVRMTEAWLLGDERALRKAAGNPRGTVPLEIPPLTLLEARADPKQLLFEAFRVASGLSGRRLANLRPEVVRHQLAELIDDFTPLRQLESFVSFEAAVAATLQALAGF